jgi:hypothetical protein
MKDMFRLRRGQDEAVRIKNKNVASPTAINGYFRANDIWARCWVLRAYGSDNGTDSDAGLDGNGEADIPSYGTEFEKRKLQIEEESEHEEGRVTRNSLDENQLGENQDLVDPDEAVHERLR